MGRFRDRQHSEPLAGGESCRMCGSHVPVGPDGRCRLGHRVREPGAAPPAPLPGEVPADAPAVTEGRPETAEAAVEPVGPAPEQTERGRTDLGPAPQPEPSSPRAAGPRPLQDPAPVADAAPWHPYDEVLAPGPRAPAPQRAPASAPEAPTADASWSPLEDLLYWDEPTQSALDVAVEEPPEPAPAADIDVADPAPAPAPAPDEASVAEDEAGVVPDEAILADGKASGPAQTAHHRLSVLLGSGALALLALAAFAVASML